MKKLRIIDINYTDYTLVDKNNREYVVNIKFYIDEKVKVGDIIFLPKSVLKEVNCYAYGPLNSKKNINDEDIIKLITSRNNYYLERYYG